MGQVQPRFLYSSTLAFASAGVPEAVMRWTSSSGTRCLALLICSFVAGHPKSGLDLLDDILRQRLRLWQCAAAGRDTGKAAPWCIRWLCRDLHPPSRRSTAGGQNLPSCGPISSSLSPVIPGPCRCIRAGHSNSARRHLRFRRSVPSSGRRLRRS